MVMKVAAVIVTTIITTIINIVYGCDKVRIQIRRRSNFKRFHQIRNSTNVLSTLLSNANS